MNIMKKLCCYICVVTMVFSMFLGYVEPLTASAADDSSSSTNVNDMTAMDALGMSTEEPEDYDENAENPYGTDVVRMQTVSELVTVGSNQTGLMKENWNQTVSYNQYGKNSTLLTGDIETLSSTTSSENYSRSVSYSTSNSAYSYSISMEGNFSKDNDGKKKQVVTMYPAVNTSEFTLTNMFDIVDGSDLSKSTTKSIAGTASTPRAMYDAGSNAFNSEWDWMAMSSLQVGDFDGDGIDEIAYTTREGENTNNKNTDNTDVVTFRILKLQEQEGNGWMNPGNWKEVYSHEVGEDDTKFIYCSNYLAHYDASISVGDFNRDGIEDLAVSCRNYNSYWTGVENPNVTFYWGAEAGEMFKQSYSICVPAVDGYMPSGISVATGDVDGDGDDETVCGAVMNDEYSHRFVAIYDWDGSKLVLTASKRFDLFEKDKNGNYVNDAVTNSGRVDDEYYSVTKGCVNLAVGAFNGPNEPDAIYMDSLLISYTDSDLTITQLYDSVLTYVDTENHTGNDYMECNVRAADLDGDGTEVPVLQIMFFKGHLDAANKQTFWTYGLTACHAAGKQFYIIAADLDGNVKSVGNSQNNSFALPDIDNDTTYMRYTNVHYYTYSDPKVLAVLASPPYFEDLQNDNFSGAIENDSTSYSKSEGSGHSDSYGNTFHVGAYVSYEHEIEMFGVTVAKVEFETEVDNNFTWEAESESSMEYEVEYSTLTGQDTVVLYSIPIETFEYEVDIPVTDDNGKVTGTKTETVGVNFSHTPCVKTISLTKYERIAKDYSDLPQIAGNILTHTLGCPETYPKTKSSLNVSNNKYASLVSGSDAVMVAPDFSEPAAATDYGMGSQTHTLSMGSEETSSFTYEVSVDVKAGFGGGDWVAGLSTGYAHSTGSCEITTEGSSYSGQIYDLPLEAEEAGYGFTWRLAAYMYADENNEFPVVTYLVNDVSQGPKLPTDFSQDEENTTKEQVALTWQYTGNPAGFIISKYYKSAGSSGFYEEAYVASGDANAIVDVDGVTKTYMYIDDNLDPDEEYQYQIQTVSNKNNVKSVPSETLVCYTLPDITTPDVEVRSSELTAYPDTPTVLSCYLNNKSALSKCTISYQWQKYNETDKVWEDVTGKKSASMTIKNAGLDDEGRYRCKVFSKSGNQMVTTKSPEINVTYSKRTALCTNFEVDTANKTATVTLSADDTNSIPSGNVCFNLQGSKDVGYVEAVLDNNGQATVSLASVKDGAYKVTVSYLGSRVFTDEEFTSFDGNPLFFTPGQTESNIVYDYADSYTYGDKLNITEYTINANGGVESEEEIDYSKAVFGIAGSGYAFTYYSGYGWYTDISKNMTMADGSELITDIIYKFQDAAIKFADEDMRDLVVDRFSRGYAAYTGTVYMLYNSRLFTLTINPKKISVGLDMSDVPDVVNAGEEANTYYSTDAMRSYMYSEDLADFGDEGDSQYFNAAVVRCKYIDTSFYSVYTQIGGVYVRCTDSSLNLNQPSNGSYTISNLQKDVYETRYYGNAYPEYYYNTGQGIYSNINGTVNLIPIGKTDKVTFYRYKVGASIANCYEWNSFTVDLSVSGGTMYKSTYRAATVGGNAAGTIEEISPALRSAYPVGTTLVYEATPYKGYEVAYWTLNGTKVAGETGTTFRTVQTTKGSNVVVHFKRKTNVLTYTVTPENATVNGKAVTNSVTISPDVTSGSVLSYGVGVTVTAAPATGWHLKNIEYQPEKQASEFVTDTTYSFNMPDTKVRLFANFERDTYKLTLATGLAAFDADGNEIESGTYVTGDTVVKVTTKEGYLFDGTPSFTATTGVKDTDSSADSFTFVMLKATKISAKTTEGYYKITAEKSAYGELTATDENGKTVDLRQKLKSGTVLTFTATPARGYKVKAWNGKSSSKYTYKLVVGEDTTVSVSYTEKKYKEVTVDPVAHGSYVFSVDGFYITTEDGKIKVYEDETVSITAKPDSGYSVSGWTIGSPDADDNLVDKYTSTFETEQEVSYTDGITHIAFAPVAISFHTIKGNAEDNGSLTMYSENLEMEEDDFVANGNSVICVAEPDDGYKVKAWTVNGTVVADNTGTVYELTNVKKDTTVSVAFEKAADNGSYEVKTEEADYGLVFVNNPKGTTKFAEGQTAELIISPDGLYELNKITVKDASDQEITLSESNDFTMPAGNVTVTTEFSLIPVHEHTVVIDEAEEPSCTKTGLTKGSHCQECREVINAQEKVPALGHIFTTTVTKEATALEAGIQQDKCDVCGKSTTSVIPKLTPTIKLSKTKVTIKKKKTYTLVISNLAKGDSVSTVKTSAKTIATVKKSAKNKYKITALKKAGTATITVVLESGKKATCKVTVK